MSESADVQNLCAGVACAAYVYMYIDTFTGDMTN